MAAAQAAEADEFITELAGRLRHGGRRAGADPVRRAAAAGRAGPRAAHRSPHPRARRRHLGGRPAGRGGDPRDAAPGHGRPDHAADRPPPLHPRSSPTGSRCWTRARLVDVGTHDELLARCPLYRLLLAGPGEDAEGDRRRRARLLRRRPSTDGGQRTGAAERAAAETTAGRSAAAQQLPQTELSPSRTRQAAASGPGRRRDGMAAVPAWPGIPPSPELLAKVAALPPATDKPEVDQAAPGPPTRTSPCAACCGRSRSRLIIGLVLDALDALASLAMPALVRGGIDHGVQAQVPRRDRRRRRWPRWPSWAPTGWSTPSRRWSSAATASGCSTRSGSRSSPTCSGSGWTSTSARWPAGS